MSRWVRSRLVPAMLLLTPFLPADAGAFDPLDTSNCYDFIVLAHDSLFSVAGRLQDDPSLRTCLVKSSEVLAAFGGDSLTVADIREFVGYSYSNWAIAPSYLLLVGDEYIGRLVGPPLRHGFIPSRLDTNDWYLSLPGWCHRTILYVDDGWMARLPDLGEKPVVHLGRIPASSPEELEHYVDKLVYYKYGDWPGGADWLASLDVLVGDRDWGTVDNDVMRTYADALIDQRLAAWPDLSVCYSADYDSLGYPDNASDDTRDAWNSGAGLINASGNTQRECELVFMAWGFCRSDSLTPTFTEQLAGTLRFPVVFAGSCLANYFYMGDPSRQWIQPDCFADDVLLSKSDRGAVASFASCHFTPALENYLMNKIFLDLFASKGIRDLGRLCTASKVEYLQDGFGEEFVAHEYCLLGDPTIQIKVPQCWECRDEDYWLEWRSGAEIEEPRVLQEIYYDDPFFIDHPNLRIVHADGSVESPCGERMIRAMARDPYGFGDVEWKLAADTDVLVERNSVLSFWINIVDSPGDAGRICLDGELTSHDWLSNYSDPGEVLDQHGNALATYCRPPVAPGWNLFYADLSAVASDPWQPYDFIEALTLHYHSDFSGGETGSLLVYVDDVQIHPTNSWRGELLNPDFEEDSDEDGKPDFWTDLDGDYTDAVGLRDDCAYSGKCCMVISDQDMTGQGAKQVVHLNEDAEMYRLRLHAKANLETSVRFLVRRLDTGDSLFAMTRDVDRDWIHCGYVFDNPWYPGDGVNLVSLEIFPAPGHIVCVDSAMMYGGSFLDVEGDRMPAPVKLDLSVMPNPANPTCKIEFTLVRGADVRVAIYDVLGRLVCELVKDDLSPGIHHRVWDGRDRHGNRVSSGVYLCRLTEGSRSVTRKLLVAR